MLINLQVWFVLSSSPVFSRTDSVTYSERFYNTVLDLFNNVEEQVEINKLLTWWNQCIIYYTSLQSDLISTQPDFSLLFVSTTSHLQE